jgi:orotate phosphoribosyltransferase-like protein
MSMVNYLECPMLYNQMNQSSSHYSLGMGSDLLEYSISCADKLHSLFGDQIDETALVYQGMSGISAATGIVMAQLMGYGKKSQQFYVRKNDESSHGDNIEYSSNFHKAQVFVFVDDFLSSGQTLSRCVSTMKRIPCSHKSPSWLCLVQGRGFSQVDNTSLRLPPTFNVQKDFYIWDGK